LRTTSGTRATLRSPSAVSFGTPTFIGPATYRLRPPCACPAPGGSGAAWRSILDSP
jgi:hypothetical protein